MMNNHGNLIDKTVKNYGLIFHKHFTGFDFEEKGYYELIKFEDRYGKFYLWIYVMDKKERYHKVEIRDYRTAEIIAEIEGQSTPTQAFKLVKEAMKNIY